MSGDRLRGQGAMALRRTRDGFAVDAVKPRGRRPAVVARGRAALRKPRQRWRRTEAPRRRWTRRRRRRISRRRIESYMVIPGRAPGRTRNLRITYNPPLWLTNCYPYVEFASMGANEPRLTQQTLKVLGTLMSRQSELSGAEIAKLLQLSSGTLYPILYRLEEFGWLDSRWEIGDPASLGRPRRRYYRITGEGARRVQQVVRELTPSSGKPAWA